MTVYVGFSPQIYNIVYRWRNPDIYEETPLGSLPPLHHHSPSPGTHQTIRPSLTRSLLWAPWGSGARKDQRGYEYTLTMEETVSSRLQPETEQRTPYHCSASAVTAGDLGPGLPRSVRGGTGAREVRERLHRHPSTILSKSLHP